LIASSLLWGGGGCTQAKLQKTKHLRWKTVAYFANPSDAGSI